MAHPSHDVSDDTIVYVIDDDESIQNALSSLLKSVGIHCRTFSSTSEFLKYERQDVASCLLLDVCLQGESGLSFQDQVTKESSLKMPIIFMTGHGDIAMSVRAMKAGALDFLAKPFRDQDMIDAVMAALKLDAERREFDRSINDLREKYKLLTPRERECISHAAAGFMNKQIASRMGIAEITAKIHRGQAMKKLECRSVTDLVRKLAILRISIEKR